MAEYGLKITDWSRDERPRERTIKFGDYMDFYHG